MEYCTKHKTQLKEYTSKRTGGKYWGHYDLTESKMCFGDETKAATPTGNSPTPQAFKQSLEPSTKPVERPLTREPIKEPDWDGIARGKVRHGVAVAFIPLVGAMPVDSDMIAIMETWVDYIMNTKTPTEDIDLPSETFKDKLQDPES